MIDISDLKQEFDQHLEQRRVRFNASFKLAQALLSDFPDELKPDLIIDDSAAISMIWEDVLEVYVDGASVAIACNKVGYQPFPSKERRLDADLKQDLLAEVKRAIAFDGESPSNKCDNLLASSVHIGTLSYFRVIFRHQDN